jgi:hypothetical protein
VRYPRIALSIAPTLAVHQREGMQIPEFMTVAEGLCFFRPQGRVSLVEGVELITKAVAHCRIQKMERLLVDVTKLTGYPVPTLADRFWMVQDWAQAAQGELIMAFVALPEYIDPGKFGVKAAADAGLKADVFTADEDARAWLLANAPDRAGQSAT